MGPIWVRQDPGGSHVGPMNFAIWATDCFRRRLYHMDNSMSALLEVLISFSYTATVDMELSYLSLWGYNFVSWREMRSPCDIMLS